MKIHIILFALVSILSADVHAASGAISGRHAIGPRLVIEPAVRSRHAVGPRLDVDPAVKSRHSAGTRALWIEPKSKQPAKKNLRRQVLDLNKN